MAVVIVSHREQISDCRIVAPDNPGRTKRSSGEWVGVDANRQRNADGSFSPIASTVPMSFSGGGAGPLATIGGRGNAVSVGWLSQLPRPELKGNTATYPEVLPGVDLRVVADVDSFNHVLVVKNRQAAQNPVLKRLDYPITTDGVALSVGAPGVVVGKDRNGAEQWRGVQLGHRTPASVAKTRTVGLAVGGGTGDVPVFGAIDAVTNCSEGAVVDCAIGVASAVPGVRLLAAGAKVSKAIKPAKQALDKADDAVAAAEKNLAKYGDSRPRNPHKRVARNQARDGLDETKGAQAAAQRKFNDVSGNDRTADLGDGWTTADQTGFGVGASLETCKAQGKLTGAVCADPTLHASVGLKPVGAKDWNGNFKGVGYLDRPLFKIPSGNSPTPTFTTVVGPSTPMNKQMSDMYDRKREYMDKKYGN